MDLKIAKPLTLKCGLELPNRLSKAAMAEGMADKQNLPPTTMDDVYGAWANGGWGMVITGNVQVDGTYLGQPVDVAVDPSDEAKILSSWKRWAKACTAGNTPAIMQISHPGRQSPLGAGKKSLLAKNLAPSPIPLNMGDGFIARSLVRILFGTPKEMTKEDIKLVVDRFAVTARLAAESGFSGVELHAAHGYLLSTFLTAESNNRTDEYGGSPQNRARIVVEIIEAVRKSVPKNFAVGVKFNSADHQSPEALQDAIQQIKELEKAGIDFLEISGGSYEDPKMVGPIDAAPRASSTVAREAFFLDFAKAIRSHFPSLPLMVTGGFRTRLGMEAALAESACDIIGIARPAAIKPALPKEILLNPNVADADARLPEKKVETPYIAKLAGLKGLGAGATTIWYAKRIQEIPKTYAGKSAVAT